MSPSAGASSTTHPGNATGTGLTGQDHDHDDRAKGPRAPSKPALDDASPSAQTVFLGLLAIRIVNALTLRTFFQPDEYFQSLEPAWRIAFGQNSGAWITWEWRSRLRSSLHPAIFAVVYHLAAKAAHLCNLGLPASAELFVAAPKATQAVFAALLDCYTWKLAQRVYGSNSRSSLIALALSVASPWQWFCSTRTLSNCLETTLTTVAVYYWPWHWQDGEEGERQDAGGAKSAHRGGRRHLSQLQLSLALAAFACILRPTNAMIWLCISVPTLFQASKSERSVLLREILLCGSAVLACSVLSDRLYYGAWALPPLRFLYFNIVQSLAVFYGRNRPDYYLTEGLPLLLTTALPFAVAGIWHSLRASPAVASTQAAEGDTHYQSKILRCLSWTSILVAGALSMIAHKEVRFLYPVLPFLHVISARPLSSFFTPLTSWRKVVLALLLAVNLLIAGYTSQVHQRGVIDVLSYLRHKHETSGTDAVMTVGFLMPCHSTPWRSHLVHPSIEAWALTCEPPLDIPLEQRDEYYDEADQFYLKPGITNWLNQNMVDTQTISGSRTQRHWAQINPSLGVPKRRAWPQNLVFFGQLEGALREYLKTTTYKECWRGFNTHVHDDRRRKGDVVVWCLDE